MANKHLTAMPKFYFHLHDGEGWIHDTDGAECPSFDVAKAKALAAIRDIVCGDIMAGRAIVLSHYVTVDDDQGIQVAKVSFGDAVSIIGG